MKDLSDGTLILQDTMILGDRLLRETLGHATETFSFTADTDEQIDVPQESKRDIVRVIVPHVFPHPILATIMLRKGDRVTYSELRNGLASWISLDELKVLRKATGKDPDEVVKELVAVRPSQAPLFMKM